MRDPIYLDLTHIVSQITPSQQDICYYLDGFEFIQPLKFNGYRFVGTIHGYSDDRLSVYIDLAGHPDVGIIPIKHDRLHAQFYSLRIQAKGHLPVLMPNFFVGRPPEYSYFMLKASIYLRFYKDYLCDDSIEDIEIMHTFMPPEVDRNNPLVRLYFGPLLREGTF